MPSIKKKNYCFACGPYNREGLRLIFQYDPHRIEATCRLRIATKYQGATGFAHGGIIATLLDEAMAKANGMGGVIAVTIGLNIRYRKMVPLRKELVLTGRRTSSRGRKLYLKAELSDVSGSVLSEARGIFLRITPDQLDR